MIIVSSDVLGNINVFMRFIFVAVFFICISFPDTAKDNQELDSLVQLMNHQTTDSLKIQSLFEIGKKYINNNPDTARYFYQEALQLAKRNELNSLVAKSYRSVGNTYFFQSLYDSANAQYAEALRLYMQLNDQIGESQILSNIGTLFLVKDNYKKAAEYYFKTLKISEEIKDSISTMSASINLGIVYTKMNELDKALKYSHKALAITSALKRRTGIRNCLLNIGDLYMLQNKYDEAFDYMNRALKMNLDDHDQNGVAYCYRGIGELFAKMHKNDKALEYFILALKLDEQLNDRKGIATCNIQIAKIHLQKENFPMAEQYCNQALDMAQKINTLELQKEANFVLFQINNNKQSYKKALQYHQAYQRLNDSIYNLENAKQVSELRTRYETEKMENENESLRTENRLKALELRRQRILRNFTFIVLFLLIVMVIISLNRVKIKRKANEALKEKNRFIEQQQVEISETLSNLEEANKELASQKDALLKQAKILEEAIETKNKFFSIISHDLINPFNIILGFTSILREGYDLFDDEQRKEYISQIDHSSHNTFKLLNDILRWAMVQGNRIELIPKDILIKDLVENSILPYKANATKKEINLCNEVSENFSINIDVFTISTVIGNLVSNSIKFTNPGGSIVISATIKGEGYLIEIKDTGVGMTEKEVTNILELKKYASQKGTHEEPGTGLGMVITKEFVELNLGRIEIASEPGVGTTFSIYLPVNVSARL